MRRSLAFGNLRTVGNHEEWLDAEAAGRYLDLPTSVVHRLITDGQLDARSFPVRVRREALDACLERCRIKPGDLPYASRCKGRGEEPPITKEGKPDRRYGSRYSATRGDREPSDNGVADGSAR